jgi:hypothetical protein
MLRSKVLRPASVPASFVMSATVAILTRSHRPDSSGASAGRPMTFVMVAPVTSATSPTPSAAG